MYMENVLCDELGRRYVVSTDSGIHKVIEAYCKENTCIYKKDSMYCTGKTVKFLYSDAEDTDFEYVVIATWTLIEIVEV